MNFDGVDTRGVCDEIGFPIHNVIVVSRATIHGIIACPAIESIITGKTRNFIHTSISHNAVGRLISDSVDICSPGQCQNFNIFKQCGADG